MLHLLQFGLIMSLILDESHYVLSSKYRYTLDVNSILIRVASIFLPRRVLPNDLRTAFQLFSPNTLKHTVSLYFDQLLRRSINKLLKCHRFKLFLAAGLDLCN
jgi:hypothetical protein